MIVPVFPLMLTTLSYGVRGAVPSLIDVSDKCGLDAPTITEINLLLTSKRNATGRWKTTFAFQTEDTNKPSDNGTALNLKQSVIKCGDKEFLQVQGVLEHDTATEVKREPFYFEKGATNAEFSNERRTVRRKTGDSESTYGSAITNQPLSDGELFEVKVDETTTKWNANHIAVGLTTVSPSEIMFANFLPNMKHDTVIYFSNSIYHNGTNVQSNYGQDLIKLKVGERVGVMRKESGSVHFFVNGVDQGAVNKKITGVVYGVVDVHGGAVQGTIVNPK